MRSGVCFEGITGEWGVTIGKGFVLWGSPWSGGGDCHGEGRLLCGDHHGEGCLWESPLGGMFVLW